MTSQPLHQPRFSLTIRVEISSVVNLCSGIAPLILLESHSPLGNYSGRCSRARPALNYFELNCTNERMLQVRFSLLGLTHQHFGIYAEDRTSAAKQPIEPQGTGS